MRTAERIQHETLAKDSSCLQLYSIYNLTGCWLATAGVEIKFSVSHPISDIVIITYFYIITDVWEGEKRDITPMYRVSKSNFRRP